MEGIMRQGNSANGLKWRTGNIAAGIILIIIMVIAFCGCSSTGNLEGKWYGIGPDMETASGNIKLNPGGELVTDGVFGTWEEDDGIIQIDIMGLHEVYTIGEYEGYQVLYREGKLAG